MRIPFQKIDKRCLGRGKIAFSENGQRRFKVALLERLRRKLPAINRHFDRFEFAQPLINALARIFLLPLHVGELAPCVGDVAHQLFVMPGCARHIATQRFNLVLQIKQAASELGAVVRRAPGFLHHFLFRFQAHGLDPLAEVQNRPARLFVVEQAGAGRTHPQKSRQHGNKLAAQVHCVRGVVGVRKVGMPASHR